MDKSTRGRRSSRSERGAAMVLGAIFFAFLAIPLCALGVDTARWWVEAQRLQAAADAASAAGVTYMPDNFVKAKARALEIAAANGYTPGSTTTITVVPGDKPTQLSVTIAQEVDNYFAANLGIASSTVTRGSMADFNAPAPMGSPCNTFGNEPAGTPAAGPAPTQLQIPSGATCSSNPDFWASINGPDIAKTQGERFASRKCAGNEDGCDSSKNNEEFDPLGYFYVVKVTNPGNPVTLQIYDPASVPSGQQCEQRPAWPIGKPDVANPWTPDAGARYGKGPGGSGPAHPKFNSRMCPGDNDMRVAGQTEAPTVTSFGVRAPTDTQVPTEGTPITGCAKQYRGTKSDMNWKRLDKNEGEYVDQLASVYHQWNTLCTFSPSVAGDYYLQVRSNVAFSGASTDLISTGNPAIFSQMTDNPGVTGTAVNSFGLRAYSSGGGVSVSAFKRMRIFVNGSSATTTFNLVRVLPSAASKTLNFGFFDVGEGAASGANLKLLPPTDSNLTSAPSCVAAGYKNGLLNDCKLSIGPDFNGKQQNIMAPIPGTYTCNWASQGGCWWRVVVDFATSAGVHDATTWTAEIQGEPVRLVQ